MSQTDSPRDSGPAGFPALQRTSSGYTAVADDLSKVAGRAISRQCVWQWWHRRDKTGFPEGELRPSPGRAHREFDLTEVRQWWDGYQHRVSWPTQRSGLQRPRPVWYSSTR